VAPCLVYAAGWFLGSVQEACCVFALLCVHYPASCAGPCFCGTPLVAVMGRVRQRYYTVVLLGSARTCVWPEGWAVVLFAMPLPPHASGRMHPHHMHRGECIQGAGVEVWATRYPPVQPALSACEAAADGCGLRVGLDASAACSHA
jgi:hypothetical protein